MSNTINRNISRGLGVVFGDSGQQATWYRYSGSAAGAPAFGIQGGAVYATAAASIIQSRNTTTREAQVAGGQLAVGGIPILSRQEFGKDDRVRLETKTYSIDGTPLAQFLGGVQFFVVNLKPV